MEVVERVLNMKGGYVLDFSDRTFDEFIAYEVGVDATAPRFSDDRGTKARRLRRILPSLAGGQPECRNYLAFCRTKLQFLHEFMYTRSKLNFQGDCDEREHWQMAFMHGGYCGRSTLRLQ